ncbi:MAG: iron donor protein CyaY [Leptothrix sp. (in: b-proteobacteria)]
MSDADYVRLTSAVLASVEAQVDRWLDADLIDIDSHRTGGLLELSFPGGSKLILNTQPPLQEIWLAARGGGFHYRWTGAGWHDTRSAQPLFEALSFHASAQGAQALRFEAPAA